LNESKLTEDQIEKIIKHLREDDERDLDESFYELHEDVGSDKDKVKNDTKGKMHEILTGYHLLGGKHMPKHADKHGDSPQEAHDKLKKTITDPDKYKKMDARAKSAAADIKKQVETGGYKIHDVHWTSKPDDVTRSTGIESNKTNDSSDIVVSTKKKHSDGKSTTIHHGRSLKVTDSTSKHVPISNLGIKSAGPNAASIHAEHKKNILRKFPKLANTSNGEQRRDLMKSDPVMDKHVRQKNTETLHKIATGLHHHLNSIPKDELVHHIRNQIHAHTTPMQMKGHGHMRHTSYTSGGEYFKGST
jgi:hypothetical protein